jgi:hypothetical protein
VVAAVPSVNVTLVADTVIGVPAEKFQLDTLFQTTTSAQLTNKSVSAWIDSLCVTLEHRVNMRVIGVGEHRTCSRKHTSRRSSWDGRAVLHPECYRP